MNKKVKKTSNSAKPSQYAYKLKEINEKFYFFNANILNHSSFTPANIIVGLGLSARAIPEKRAIGISYTVNVNLKEEDVEFLKYMNETFFEIQDFEKIIEITGDKFTSPEDAIPTFSRLAFSAIRGIIFEKTNHHILLPAITLSELITNYMQKAYPKNSDKLRNVGAT